MTRFLALLLTVLTGFSGLVYEVTWQKYLATLLGSHAEATAAVLAIFLGGLSVGYAFFGKVTRRHAIRARRAGRPPRLLLIYGLIEGCIGAYALLFPALFGIAQSLSHHAPFHAGAGFAFDVVLTIALIGPPTVLMGATIPILTLALAGDLQHATRVHAWVYGFNTIGAFAGALAGGFFLIPWLGLDGVLFAMGGVNLLAGAAFALLGYRTTRVTPDLSMDTETSGTLPGFAGYATIAFLAGFAMMAVQTILNRIGGLAFGASHFTFSMVVAAFVLCIALGSLVVSALPRITPLLIVSSQWLLVLLLGLFYSILPDLTYYAHVLRMVFRNESEVFYPFHIAAFACLLAIMLIPVGLSGALLPLLFHHLRRQVGTLGSTAGKLYSWNTIGSLVGALLGGYVLLFWLDLHHVYRIALAALTIGAALLSVMVLRVSPVAIGLFVVLPSLLGFSMLQPWSQERLSIGAFRLRQPQETTFSGADEFYEAEFTQRLVFYDDDPTTSVSIREGPRKGGKLNLGLFTNGKPDSNLILDYPTTALLALIPALLADNLERSFIVGYGTGVTAGELAALDGVREVHVAEISQGVIDSAPLFDEGNLDASKSPKVVVHRSDAYRALLRSEGLWNLIISEPSNPWVAGVEMLYSLEFLKSVRERLAPGGVFGQWAHLYELDADTFEIILRNYAAAFDHVSVWLTMGNDALLIGFDDPHRATDLRTLRKRFRRPDFAAGFKRSGISNFPGLLAHEVIPLGTVHAANLEGEMHTLRHPILSHFAARAFFVGAPTVTPRFLTPEATRIGVRNSLLRRFGERNGRMTESVLEAAALESCRLGLGRECAALFARWRYDHPDSGKLTRALDRARNYQGMHADATRTAQGSTKFITDAALDSLVPFFGGPRESRRRAGLGLIAKMTTSYILNYHYAVPFDRRFIEDLWAECTGPQCAIGIAAAEEEFGPFGTSLPKPRATEHSPPTE